MTVPSLAWKCLSQVVLPTGRCSVAAAAGFAFSLNNQRCLSKRPPLDCFNGPGALSALKVVETPNRGLMSYVLFWNRVSKVKALPDSAFRLLIISCVEPKLENARKQRDAAAKRDYVYGRFCQDIATCIRNVGAGEDYWKVGMPPFAGVLVLESRCSNGIASKGSIYLQTELDILSFSSYEARPNNEYLPSRLVLAMAF